MYRLLLIFILFPLLLSAQSRPVVYQQQAWLGYYPQLKFSTHWGIWFDSEIHTAENYFSGFSQATFRLAGTYYNRKKNKFTAGVGYTDYFPGENHPGAATGENFFWEQYQWFNNNKRAKLMQWIRLEEKWKQDVSPDHTPSDNWSFMYRTRYNIFYQLSLSSKGVAPHVLSLAMGDELYLYYGPSLPNHLFDQNRIFLGLSYSVNSHDNLVFGVTNIYQEDLSGKQFKDNNVIRLSFFQNIGVMRATE